MAERPIWRGHLRLALVSCPVALHNAQRERANLHFHLINPDTGNRVRMVSQDAGTGHEVARRDLVRGYEFEKDRYLLLDEQDFAAARIDSSATIVIDKFVRADAIDPIYFDGSYWVAPDGETGADVFVVLRAAIEQSGMAGLARVVINRRERAITLQPHGRGLVAHVLREERDIASPANLFRDIPEAKPDTEMVKLACQLIDRQEAKFYPADIEDRYETRLRAVIEAKLKGEGIAPARAAPAESNVIDLMAAQRRSLGQDKPKPAKAAAARARSPAKKSPARAPKKRQAG